MLCKPFGACYPHLYGQTSSRTGTCDCTGFRGTGDPVCHRKPTCQALVPLCQARRYRPLFLQFHCRLICLFRTISPAYDICSQSLRYHYHKLYSSSGRTKILIPFSPLSFCKTDYVFRHDHMKIALFFCRAVFI